MTNANWLQNQWVDTLPLPTSLFYCTEPLFGPGDCPVERHKYHSIGLYEKGAHALVLFQTPAHENSKNDTDEEAHVDSGRRESMKLVTKKTEVPTIQVSPT